MPHLGQGVNTSDGSNHRKFFKLAILVVIIGGLAWLTYDHFHKAAQEKAAAPISVENFEKGTDSARAATLKTKDYKSYIIQHVVLASDYTASKKYDDAERIMNEVFANVPKNDINSMAYGAMVGIEQAKGDNAKYKQYLGLLIEQLKKEGDAQGAAGYQKQLDSAK